MHTISCQNNHYILENLPAHMNNRSLIRNAITNSTLCDKMTRIEEVGQTLHLKKVQHRNTGHHLNSGSIVWNEYGRRFISNNNNYHGLLQHPIQFNCCPIAQCNCYPRMDCTRNNYAPRVGLHRKYQKYNRSNSSTGNLICIQTQKLQNCELIHAESLQAVHGCKESSHNKNDHQNDYIEQRSHSKQIDNAKPNVFVEKENCNEERLNHNEIDSTEQNDNNENSNPVKKSSDQIENKKTVKYGEGSRYIENVDLLRNNINNNHNSEKTPMCLLNDLARYNKIQFQYRLTSENGPAHCKKFAVTLKLGDEEYKAEACKIKQAQHLAAKEAIDKTKYKHPIPKSIRRHQTSYSSDHVTPTVELNALTMKMGQQTLYIFDSQTEVTEVKSNINAFIENNNNNNSAFTAKFINNICNTRNMIQYNPNLIYMGNNFNEMNVVQRRQQRYNQPFLTKLSAPQQCYNNTQRPPLLWNGSPFHACLQTPCKITLLVGNQKFIGIGKTLQQAKHDAAAQALQVIKAQLKQNSVRQQEDHENGGEIKSPISMVFEIANKRGLSVSFKVLHEDGPAHMRKFTTACIVGTISAEAEGTGKKTSKRKAAQKMLEELQKLPPVTPPTTPTRNTQDYSQNQLIVDENKTKNQKIRFLKGKGKRKFYLKNTPNAIKELIEHHQNLNEVEPEFILISVTPSDVKSGRQRQFVMEARSKDHSAQGVGNSKRVAKLKAAKNLLIAMGLRAVSKSVQSNNMDIKIADTDETQGHECKETNTTLNKPLVYPQETLAGAENVSPEDKQEADLTITDIASNLPKSTDENNRRETTTRSHPQMKDQLLYLANLIGFEVKFCDYPKGNHTEFLTIVMLSTTPPQICHGIGLNTEESQENAAKNSLKILSEMGINNT